MPIGDRFHLRGQPERCFPVPNPEILRFAQDDNPGSAAKLFGKAVEKGAGEVSPLFLLLPAPLVNLDAVDGGAGQLVGGDRPVIAPGAQVGRVLVEQQLKPAPRSEERRVGKECRL